MAITKLSNIGMPQGGGAAHLKNCITYIMNPDKTEGMVGGNAGTTPQEMYDIYMEKNRENFNRQLGLSQKEGYKAPEA